MTIIQEIENGALEVAHVLLGHLSADNLLMSIDSFLSLTLLTLFLSLING